MGYLSVTLVAAIATAIAVFGETGSILLSMLTYSVTGCAVLCLALLVTSLFPAPEEIDDAKMATE